ncbi:MAG: ACT domain-containing protein [Dehalococcoidia bacterium]
MPAFRAIRIQMPDRPGALSAISAALAAHQVDIVHLDVVSHGQGAVVDDLVLSAPTAEDIGAAIGSFYPEVIVRTFDDISGDPALEMGASLGKVAVAASLGAAHSAAVSAVRRIARADEALLLGLTQGGGMAVLANSVAVPVIAPAEPFAGYWALQNRAGVAFPVADGWAPQRFQHALSAAWVAIVPTSPSELMLAVRKLNIPFYPGELERFAAFGAAAGAIFSRLDPAPAETSQALPPITLPPRAVTSAKSITVA